MPPTKYPDQLKHVREHRTLVSLSKQTAARVKKFGREHEIMKSRDEPESYDRIIREMLELLE